jgi:RNA polymerase sigma factor (TIGR02999 family)
MADSNLIATLYEELRALAERRLARSPQASLRATELVHEVYTRFAHQGAGTWDSQADFFFAAARAMQNILVEHARKRQAQKRGGDWVQVALTLAEAADDEMGEDVLAVNDALDKLAVASPEAARLVSLRYFAGLTMPEVADVLGLSLSSAERRWRFARAWLRRAIEDRAE